MSRFSIRSFATKGCRFLSTGRRDDVIKCMHMGEVYHRPPCKRSKPCALKKKTAQLRCAV
jgi:hypothetical protein